MTALYAVPDPDDRPPIDREQYAGYLVVNGLADATVRVYSAMVQRWVDWAEIHGYDPYVPDPLAVRAWSQTVNGTRSSLAHARAAIGHWCRAAGTPDVSGAVHLPRHPKRTPRGLDPERAAQLAAHASEAGLKGIAVLVGLYTAARRSEIATLAWSRVDFPADLVTLQRSKTRDMHTVPLHPHLRAVLEPRYAPGDLWVFAGRNGGHVSPAVVWQWVRDVAEDAGVGKVTPHQLRHTALTAAYRASLDLRAVQDFAGHTKTDTTVVYTAVDSDAMARAIGGLDFTNRKGD